MSEPLGLPRIAVVADLREERWPSMDLAVEMLLLNLRAPEARLVEAIEVRPPMTRRFTRLPGIGRAARMESADRILNRVWDYPRWLRPRAWDFDLFHIVDHSYAHLATRLPAGRSLITCHDVDAFRGVLPGSRGGSIVQRALGRRLLEGMRAARTIVCVSRATRHELVSAGIVPASRIVVVPNGVHPAYVPHPHSEADRMADALLGAAGNHQVELVHVGSTIPRKRIDVLLRVVAALRRSHAGVRLIRVGGPFTADQHRLVGTLGLDDSVTVLPFVERRVLASIYRRAVLVLQPSDLEGFGLPVAEAMTCGTPVVASDLPALREVGGPTTTYCQAGDVEGWVAAVDALLDQRANDAGRWRARQADGIDWARRFEWQAQGRATLDVYRDVLAALASDDGRRVARM